MVTSILNENPGLSLEYLKNTWLLFRDQLSWIFIAFKKMGCPCGKLSSDAPSQVPQHIK